ncbi:MAG: hypothetical protein GF330_02720 [Candidatus Eisenbacteria bacterium]|nr:hypothetical protein [Candidatus Eisenbacteria bacterium]
MPRSIARRARERKPNGGPHGPPFSRQGGGDGMQTKRRARGRARVWHGCAGVLAAGVLILTLLGCGGGEPDGVPVVVIGLDGATWDLLQPWIDAGELPTLAAIQRGSAWGELQSIVPYLSPPAWASAVTGVNPGKHAIFDFQRRVPGETAIVNETAKSRRAQPIWKMLAPSGRRCLLLNIPMTDPPDPIEGLFVAGFPHPDEIGYTYPPELADQLGDYELDRLEMKIERGQEDSLFAAYTRMMEERKRIVLAWLRNEPFDLLWAVFTGTDRMQHLFWKFADPDNPHYDPALAERYGGAIHDFWVAQDAALGEILSAVPAEAAVMLLSDHGFGPLRFSFLLHDYLERESARLSERENGSVLVLDPSDATRLYVLEKGRDPGATLSPAEARRARATLLDELRGAVDPGSGERICERIWTADEVFHGTYAEKGPEIVVLPTDGYMPTMRDQQTLSGRGFVAAHGAQLSGWHRMNGIYALQGPDASAGRRNGESGRDYSLIDIVPTLLYLLGEPIPEGLDGQLMRAVIAPERLAAAPPQQAPPLEEEFRELTPEELQNLRNLPYIGG